jgi:exodeoxyribonuclease VII small subunit
MTEEPGRDLLDRLENTIGRLADGSAPLEELVAAHQQAVRLLAEAENELEDLRTRADELTRALAAP